MKHYEVRVTAFATVLVENCKDQEDALERASDHVNFGTLVLDDMHIHREINTKNELAIARRHADAITKK